MITQQWLSRFLLIVLAVTLSTCFRFFREDEFLGAPITNSEIDKLLLKGYEEDLKYSDDEPGKVFGRSNIIGHQGMLKVEEKYLKKFYTKHAKHKIAHVTKRTLNDCYDKVAKEDNMIYTAKNDDTCKKSVNAVLQSKGTARTLEGLTSNYFNGETYVVISFKETGGKLSSISCISQGSVKLFKLVLGEEQDPSTLTLHLGDWDESALSFKSVGINVAGNSKMKMKNGDLLPYAIETEIEKAAGSEVYEITKFDFSGEGVNWLELIGVTGAMMTLDNMDIVSKIGDTLPGFTGFGAFTKEQDYQIGIIAKGDIVKTIAGAKKLTILLSQNHLKSYPVVTVFVEYDEETQLIRGIDDLIPNSGIDGTFMLNKANSGKWCVLVVTSHTEYLEPIKSRLSHCVGALDGVIESGVHFYVKVNFKAVLMECGNPESAVTDISNSVGIYGTISNGGVSTKLPDGLDAPLDMLMKCGGTVSQELPSFLGGNRVKLIAVAVDPAKGLFKFGIEITLSPEYNRIPGTSITMNKFSLLTVRKEDEDTGEKYWAISAAGEVGVGEAIFDISIEKEQDTYTLKISVDQFTLADMISVFNTGSSLLEDEIFQTLGINDFSVEWTFGGDGPMTLSIRGTPLIFGYDNLHFNAILEVGGSRKRRSTEKNSYIQPKSKNDIGALRDRRSSSSVQFSIAIFLDGADFDSIVSTFTGTSQTSLNWLSGLKAVVIVSTTDGTVTNGESTRKSRAKAKRTVRHHHHHHSGKKKLKRHRPSKRTKALHHKHVRKSAVTSHHHHVQRSKRNRVARKRDGGVADEEEEEEEEDEGIELIFPTLGEDFADTTFGLGLTFGVTWRIPETLEKCNGNGLCGWMVENLGSSFSFSIKGSVSPTSIMIAGKLEGYAIITQTKDKNELAFTGLELVIDTPSIRLEATMEYKDITIGAWERPLIFKGSIEASPIQIMLEFSMENFIYPTVLTEYIAIGNIHLGIGYVFGAPLPSFVFGAAIKLGKLDPTTTNEEAIQIEGHFGVSPGNPGENWVYGAISKLTVGQICIAFELECNGVSKLVLESGFPYGIKASFSAEERDEPGVGIIPAGLAIKGTINFLGFECSCDMSIAKDDTGGWAFSLDLEMSALNWGNGMIQVTRTSDDLENGPMADIKLSTAGDFYVKIQGYVSFLSLITAGVNIEIDDTHIKFEIEGPLIIGLLDVHILVEANYGGSSDMLFSFEATLSTNNNFQQALLDAIIEFLGKIKELVSAAINAAKEGVKKAKAKIDKADKAVKAWQDSIDAWKKKLAKQKKDLQAEANKAPSCNCPNICFAFFGWNSRCWKIWGHWCGCPKWNKCYSKVKDIGCYIRCAAKKLASTLVRWAKQAILEITLLVADGAKALGSLASGVLSIGKGLLTVAEGALDFVNSAIQWALDAAETVMTAILSNFKLYHLTLAASLTADYTACVRYDVSVLLVVNITSKGEACLDVSRFLGSIVGGVADGPDAPAGLKDEHGNSISSSERSVNDANGRLKEVDNAAAELDKEERSVNSEVSRETRKDFANPSKRDDIASLRKMLPALARLPKRHTVHTKEEMETINLAHTPIPNYDMTRDPDLRSIDTNAPWAVVHVHTQPLGYNATVSSADVREKRELDYDEKLNPCDRLKRALSGYAQLTDGLILHTNYIADGAESMMSQRNENNEKLRNARSVIEASEREHNMTVAQRENAYFLYRKARKGYDELHRKSNIIINRENRFGLTVVRRQLNDLLSREKKGTFSTYIEHIHTNAIRGYKRSLIPHPSDAKGEQLLSSIKQELQSIVTDEDSALVPMSMRLMQVKKSIVSMKPYTKQCEK